MVAILCFVLKILKINMPHTFQYGHNYDMNIIKSGMWDVLYILCVEPPLNHPPPPQTPDEAITSRDDSRTSPSQFTSDITTTSKAWTPLAWLTRGHFDCGLHLFDIALFNLITTKSNNASHTYKWDPGQRLQPWGPRYKGYK